MADKINVKFLRGSQAGFDAKLESKNFVPGAFYLTEDTHRLYAANQAGNDADLLSQSIVFVASTDDLPDGVKVKGQIYYITGSNILCTWDGSAWKQINPDSDTKLGSLAFEVSSSTNSATIAETAGLLNKGGQAVGNVSSTGNVTFTGENDITVSASGNTIKISDKAYGIGVESGGTEVAQINLEKAGSAISGENVKIAAGSGIGLSVANGTITLSADTQQPQVTNTIEAVSEGFESTVNVGAAGATATLDPIIQIGIADAKKESVHFENGTAELNVYTKDEIDAKEIAMNGMTYKGVVFDSSHPALPTSNVRIGDTYRAAANSGAYKKNDIIIANGTEGTDGYISGTITWDIIPAADGVDTTYDFSAGAGAELVLAVHGGSEEQSVAIVGDGTWTSTETSGDNIKVSHAGPGAKASTKGDASTSAVNGKVSDMAGVSFKAVTGVEIDAKGHVTGVTENTVSVRDTVLSSAEGSIISADSTASNNVATVAMNVNVADTSGVAKDAELSFTIGSSGSLNITEDTAGAVVVDLVWGSF